MLYQMGMANAIIALAIVIPITMMVSLVALFIYWDCRSHLWTGFTFNPFGVNAMVKRENAKLRATELRSKRSEIERKMSVQENEHLNQLISTGRH